MLVNWFLCYKMFQTQNKILNSSNLTDYIDISQDSKLLFIFNIKTTLSI